MIATFVKSRTFASRFISRGGAIRLILCVDSIFQLVGNAVRVTQKTQRETDGGVHQKERPRRRNFKQKDYDRSEPMGTVRQ